MTRTALALATVVLVSACSGGAHRVTGVVINVDGDLSGIRSFEIVTSDGERLSFEPGEGVDTFAHGGPLTHLSEHLQTGSPIRVTYEEENGTLIAREVDDAG